MREPSAMAPITPPTTPPTTGPTMLWLLELDAPAEGVTEAELDNDAVPVGESPTVPDADDTRLVDEPAGMLAVVSGCPIGQI